MTRQLQARPSPRASIVIVLVLVLVGAACGSGETTEEGAQAAASSGATQASIATESTTAPPEAAIDSVTVADVELPPGILMFDAPNQTAVLGELSFLVTYQADGIRLVSVSADGVGQTDAVIAGAVFGEVWNSGSRVVLSGADQSGDLVMMASADGEDFSETRIPIPAHYVGQDVWDATSLVANVEGVADLGDDLYVIAWMGINWTWINDVVARSAYSISDEVGDAARFASVVKRVPQADGDFLFTFETDGTVIYEVLGSEAGVEPGYTEAYDASINSDSNDFGFYGAWIVSDSGVTEDGPPLEGGLDGDLRLNQLYPVDGGVAALVTDWSPDAAVQSRFLAGGGGKLSAGFTSRRESTRAYGIWWRKTQSGNWTPADPTVGVPEGTPPKIWRDSRGTFIMVQARAGKKPVVEESQDGLDWETSDTSSDEFLPDGGGVTVVPIDGGAVVLVHPAEGEVDYHALTMGTLGMDGIDVKPAEPIPWTDPTPPPIPEEKKPKRKTTWGDIGIEPIELFFNGVLFESVGVSVFSPHFDRRYD